ncbi:MAG: exosortase/archaeosortase family protein [Acidobacteriota bacterium]|nr:exosortase/archaeosortase family protein [Acidobacteriota bacterium]
MTPVVETPPKNQIPWPSILWFALLVLAGYAPVLQRLAGQWLSDEDMGHGFFVPAVALFIVWQRREEILGVKREPSLWGMALVAASGVLLVLATLGAELFTARLSFVFTLIGMVWTLGGRPLLRKLAFPLFLLFFMVPIPAVIYNRITFPLQILASRLADNALNVLNIPVIREGNVLELANKKLNVVEACSGIRSLLSLTFLSLVYGYFFEKRNWLRAVLFFSTIPIAIVANGSRVSLTAILTQFDPELAEGFFHEAQGWVIFMVALVILIVWHQFLGRAAKFMAARRAA